MDSFWDALLSPTSNLIRNAVIVGVLSCFSFGVVGSYVVVKRISYIAGAIAHCVLGGIGLSLFVRANYGVEWFTPMIGTIFAAILAAVIIGFVSIATKEREDSVIGTLWVVGMSLGIILISKTPGYVDVNSYLFGNILLVSSNDISLIIGTSLVIITTIILFYNKLMITCFDEEYARIKGINTKFYYILLLILVALTVVIMVRLVGIVLVVAMLTLPPAIASNFSKRLRTMMFLSVFVGIICVFSGIAISYSPDLPSGATIVLLTAAIYLTILSVRTLVNKLRKFLEQS